MEQTKKIEDLLMNPFSLIGKEWMLITAGNKDKVNTMTASWGGMGHLWNKNVVYIFVRPQRYTKEFIDANDCFSVSFFDQKYRAALGYFGTVSGKDEDKIAKQNMQVNYKQDVPYIEQGKLHFICKKLYVQRLDSACFIDKEADTKNYPEKDYHDVYVAEIIDIIESN